MKRKKIRFIISSWLMMLMLLIASVDNLQGQQVEGGAGLGILLYWGDLTPKDPVEGLSNARGGGQFFLRSEISSKVDIRFNLMIGKLNGDDRKSSNPSMMQRNLRFHSWITELSILGEYTFLSFDLPEYQDGLSFYLTTGVSALYFNPKTDYQGNTYALQPLGTEGQGMEGFPDKYNRISMALPFGGGMKIRLTERLTLNPEIIGRVTFTDYLDDVSGSYVNYTELLNGNGEIAAALGNRQGEFLGQSEPVITATGAVRGGPNSDDFYWVGMINFTYLLSEDGSIFSRGKKKYNSDCPTF
ncbi:MAG: hypothetical protein HKN68_15280 [Saprospiraceae bacterium]|nr:hypothetical protein [Saprospiraceae bacterium]